MKVTKGEEPPRSPTDNLVGLLHEKFLHEPVSVRKVSVFWVPIVLVLVPLPAPSHP